MIWSKNGVGRHSKAQQWHTQHHVVVESDLVLSECVAHDLVGPGVLDPVDLDDHAPLLPVHVEDIAASARSAYDLAGRLGDASAAALPGELQLTERPHATEQVEQHFVQEQPALVAAHAQHLLGDLRSTSQTLLDRHGHHERGLLVAAGPECRTDRRHRRAASRNTGPDDVIRRPSTSLPDVEAAGPPNSGTSGHGHTYTAFPEVLQASRFESSCAVEEPTRAGLEDRGPVLTGAREWSGGDCHALRTDTAPAPGADLRSHLRAGDSDVVQLDARDHAVLTLGDLQRGADGCVHASGLPGATAAHTPSVAPCGELPEPADNVRRSGRHRDHFV